MTARPDYNDCGGRDPDGAPYGGGVTDPATASGPGIPMPRYTGTIIAACPQCGTDLVDEAFSYYCLPCQRSWSFTEVALFEDGDRDD